MSGAFEDPVEVAQRPQHSFYEVRTRRGRPISDRNTRVCMALHDSGVLSNPFKHPFILLIVRWLGTLHETGSQRINKLELELLAP